MKLLIGMTALALMSGLAMGDTITQQGGSPVSFTNIPTGTPTSPTSAPSGPNNIPYWDNTSTDCSTHPTTCNIGDFLTATGGFTGGTNYNPSQYVSGAGSGGTNDAPPSFNLVQTTNSLLISLLGTNTGSGGDTFGIYDASKTTTGTAAATEIPLFNLSSSLGVPSANEAAAFASNDIGFYVTNAGDTWFSNSALNSGTGDTAGHQHFVLFTSATNPNILYLGLSDWLFGNGGEGNGDYQDMVFSINSTALIPEPATFALLGAGLLGLGFARFRSRKNRA